MNRQFKSLTDTDDVYIACTAAATVKLLHGRWTGAGVGYLQVHDRLTAPVAEAPLRTFQLAASSSYFFDLSASPLECENGVVLTFSDDPDNASSATGAGDFQGALDTQEPEGLTYSGLLDGAFDSPGGYILWNSATNARLHRLRVTNAVAGRFLQVFDLGTVPDGTIPRFTMAIPTGTNLDVCFGADGWAVNGAGQGDCVVAISSTGPTYSGVFDLQAAVYTWHFL